MSELEERAIMIKIFNLIEEISENSIKSAIFLGGIRAKNNDGDVKEMLEKIKTYPDLRGEKIFELWGKSLYYAVVFYNIVMESNPEEVTNILNMETEVAIDYIKDHFENPAK